jgi:hypothetical protein
VFEYYEDIRVTENTLITTMRKDSREPESASRLGNPEFWMEESNLTCSICLYTLCLALATFDLGSWSSLLSLSLTKSLEQTRKKNRDALYPSANLPLSQLVDKTRIMRCGSFHKPCGEW